MIYRILDWLEAWAELAQGIVGVLTLGTIRPLWAERVVCYKLDHRVRRATPPQQEDTDGE